MCLTPGRFELSPTTQLAACDVYLRLASSSVGHDRISALQAARASIDTTAPWLAKMAWAMEISKDRAFVTTDRPVAMWKRDTRDMTMMGIGLENSDEVRFSLGPHHLLVLRPRYPEHRTHVESGRVAEVNRHLAAGCYEMVIARPSDRAELAQLSMRRIRPALRFNTAPLLEPDATGRLVPAGQKILHTYVSYGDVG